MFSIRGLINSNYLTQLQRKQFGLVMKARDTFKRRALNREVFELHST